MAIDNCLCQVSEQWVARYNGPGNNQDAARSLAVDGSGNVYVTGWSSVSGANFDYTTIKYNSSGDSVWVARYNGPGNATDDAYSLAVDGSGNVYVTGRSVGSGTDYDYATIKYNSSGVQQWVQRYNGPGNSADLANSLAVDGSGNVYVTGSSIGSGTYADYATIKYNSSGVQQWIQRYYGLNTMLIDEAQSIAVDGSGNVYVTGWSSLSGANLDYLTIKYNSSGVQQWTQRYAGNGVDEPYSIAIDGSGNIYVTGGIGGPTYDYATIKYNPSGIQQWVAIYNGPGNANDKAFSLALDNSANVYMTGYSVGSGTSTDYATIKYNSSGVQQWVQRYNGPGNNSDVAYSLAIDGLGNVFVTGASIGSGTGNDYATIKYNSSGVQQWVQRYNGPGNGIDGGMSIAVDNLSNVYVTGTSFGSGTNYDYATIKYVQSPPASAPVLFSPPNNSQGWGLTVNLVWYRVPNTANYRVQLSTDSLFNTLILNDSTVTDSVRTVSGLINNTYYFWRVTAKNAAGTGPWSAVWKFRTGFVGIKPLSSEIPKEFKLYDNYPNPFNPVTKIKFNIPLLRGVSEGRGVFVQLIVYDALGRELETILSEQLNAGTYEVDWNASNYTSGIYFYSLISDGYSETRKMVCIK